MNIEIKFLNGYENSMSNDNNSISFVIKTNRSIKNHLEKTKIKIYEILKDMIKKHEKHGNIYFNFRIKYQTDNHLNDWEYINSKNYHINKNNFGAKLDDVIEYIKKSGEMLYKKSFTHFVNIKIQENQEDDEYENVLNYSQNEIENNDGKYFKANKSNDMFVDEEPKKNLIICLLMKNQKNYMY